MSVWRTCLATALIGVAAINLAAGHPIPKQDESTAQDNQQPLVSGLRLESFDCAKRQVVVEASRGYAGRKRLGFLQTALVPTLELEEVSITTFNDDGTVETRQAPQAILDLRTKTIFSSSGKILARQPSSIQPSATSQAAATSGFCQG
jgi:hypothetical protein